MTPVEPRTSSVTLQVMAAIHGGKGLASARAEGFQKVRDGTHRFKIYSGQAIAVQPHGFFVNRAEDRARKITENAAAIELWSRRQAVRTPDGLEIRER